MAHGLAEHLIHLHHQELAVSSHSPRPARSRRSPVRSSLERAGTEARPRSTAQVLRADGQTALGHFQGWACDRPSHWQSTAALPAPQGICSVPVGSAKRMPLSRPQNQSCPTNAGFRVTAAISEGLEEGVVENSSVITQGGESSFAEGNECESSPSPRRTRPGYSITDCAPRYFVVNTSRFIERCELLNLINILIESTAIAALTMTAAGSLKQFRNTIIFVTTTYVMYFIHNARHDILEISDMKKEISITPSSPPENMNQILKCMTVRDGCMSKLLESTIVFLITCLLATCWSICRWAWGHPCPDDYSCEEARTPLLFQLVGDSEDTDKLGEQLLVFSLIMLLHMCYEFVIAYETRCTMSFDPSSGKGLPLRCRLLGLPSMWFASKEAEHAMRRFLSALHGQHDIAFFPEQLAAMAMDGEAERNQVACTLRECELFPQGHEGLEKLALQLLFYSASSRTYYTAEDDIDVAAEGLSRPKVGFARSAARVLDNSI